MFRLMRVELESGKAIILKRVQGTAFGRGSYLVQVLEKNINNRWEEIQGYRYISRLKDAEIFFNYEWSKAA